MSVIPMREPLGYCCLVTISCIIGQVCMVHLAPPPKKKKKKVNKYINKFKKREIITYGACTCIFIKVRKTYLPGGFSRGNEWVYVCSREYDYVNEYTFPAKLQNMTGRTGWSGTQSFRIKGLDKCVFCWVCSILIKQRDVVVRWSGEVMSI